MGESTPPPPTGSGSRPRYPWENVPDAQVPASPTPPPPAPAGPRYPWEAGAAPAAPAPTSNPGMRTATPSRLPAYGGPAPAPMSTATPRPFLSPVAAMPQAPPPAPASAYAGAAPANPWAAAGPGRELTLFDKLKPFAIPVVVVVVILFNAWRPLKWETYASDAGGFTVEFPGKPKVQHQTSSTPAGPIPMSLYEVTPYRGLVGLASPKSLEFAVMHAELPAEADNVGDDMLMDNFRDGVLQAIRQEASGTLIHEQPINMLGYPGRDFLVDTSRGLVTGRIFKTGRRFYSIFMLTAEGSYEEERNRFFMSFRLSGSPIPESTGDGEHHTDWGGGRSKVNTGRSRNMFNK